jgi:3-hydroxyacyl-[acyl-carrier-protein] dehydratase
VTGLLTGHAARAGSAPPTGSLIALDRVVTIEPCARAVALRNVTHTLAIFDSHFPRRPVLPGVLVLASMRELARIVLESGTGPRWRLAAAERVQYRRFVQPGDQMEIDVEVRQLGDRTALLGATARVDGKVVTSARSLRMVFADPDGHRP